MHRPRVTRTIAAAAAVVLALAGCQDPPAHDTAPAPSPSDAPGQETPRMTAVPYRLLEVREMSALTQPERVAWSEPAVFLAGWQRAHAGTNPGIVLPSIEAGRETAVLVALGERPSGGHAIRVSAAEMHGDSLLVHVESSRPGPGCMTTAVMTQPYQIVAIAWHGPADRIRFVEHERIDDCR